MSFYQRNFLQNSVLWLGIVVLGVPVILGIATLLYASIGLVSFGVGLIIWLAFCLVIRAMARWIGIKSALIEGGIFVAGFPLALLLFALANTLNLTFLTHLPGSASQLILYWFLGCWSLISGLSTRNRRGVYIALHFANWFFWIGIVAALAQQGTVGTHILVFFCVPLSISLIMWGLYKPVLHTLEGLPFLRQTLPKTTDGPSSYPSEQEYEQGYQPAYAEQETPYATAYESDAPTYISQRNQQQQGMQQQQ